MDRLRFQLLAGIFVMALFLAGCSSAPPGPRVPVVTEDPIPVDGATVSVLTIPEVYVSLEPETLLGYHFEGAGMSKAYDYRWGPNFSAEIEEMNDDVIAHLDRTGYRIVHHQPGGVPETASGEPVLELRATIDLLELNSFTIGEGYFQAYCEIIWTLTAPGDAKPLFKAETAGYRKENEHLAGVFRQAFNNALMNLLADENFVAAASAGR